MAGAVAGVYLSYGPGADIPAVRERFFRMIASGSFLPNTPTLTNAGTPGDRFCACSVIPAGDSFGEIFGASSGIEPLSVNGRPSLGAEVGKVTADSESTGNRRTCPAGRIHVILTTYRTVYPA